MAEYGDLNYTTTEINTDLAKVHDKEAVVEEAPKDDKQYARKNGAWAVIEASGGSSEHTLDLSPLFDSEGSPVDTVTDEFLAEVKKAYEERYSNAIGLGGMPYVLSLSIADMGETYDIYIVVPISEEPLTWTEYSFVYSINKTTKELSTKGGGFFTLLGNGSGTKALTDNGQYAEFASPTKVVSGGSGTVTKQLSPNILYEFGECTSLTITLASEISGIRNEYMFEFVSGTTPTMLSIPETVGWMGGKAPTIEANKTYQCSIVNNIAVIGGK